MIDIVMAFVSAPAMIASLASLRVLPLESADCGKYVYMSDIETVFFAHKHQDYESVGAWLTYLTAGLQCLIIPTVPGLLLPRGHVQVFSEVEQRHVQQGEAEYFLLAEELCHDRTSLLRGLCIEGLTKCQVRYDIKE